MVGGGVSPVKTTPISIGVPVVARPTPPVVLQVRNTLFEVQRIIHNHEYTVIIMSVLCIFNVIIHNYVYVRYRMVPVQASLNNHPLLMLREKRVMKRVNPVLMRNQ